MSVRYFDIVGNVPGVGVLAAALSDVVPATDQPTAIALMAWLAWSVIKYALDKTSTKPSTSDQQLELIRRVTERHAVHDRVCEDTLTVVRNSQRIQEQLLTEVKAMRHEFNA